MSRTLGDNLSANAPEHRPRAGAETRDIPPIGMVSARVEHLERLRGYGISRVEIVQFRCSEGELRRIVAEEWPIFSAHCPLLFPDWYPDWPLTAALVDLDEGRRRATMGLIEHTVGLAAELGAQYVNVHAERPALLLGETRVQEADEEAGVALAREGCEWLQEQARQSDLPMHIENMVANPLFWSADHYLHALADLPDVHVCLDLGHLALNAAKFGFSVMEWIAALAPRIGSVHVYNNRYHERFEFEELRGSELLRKLPVHPGQSPHDGWLDVPAILETVLAARPDCCLNHEIYASLDTDPQVTREGIAWVQELWEQCVGGPPRPPAEG